MRAARVRLSAVLAGRGGRGAFMQANLYRPFGFALFAPLAWLVCEGL